VVSEQKVEVAIDPDLKVSTADLRAQWDALEQISALMRGTSEILREADRHADSADWRALRGTLARPRNLSAVETGPRLSEQLQSLYNLIDGPNDAPTRAMKNLLGELEEEYRRAQTLRNGLAR
jgi:hypothetical protein